MKNNVHQIHKAAIAAADRDLINKLDEISIFSLPSRKDLDREIARLEKEIASYDRFCMTGWQWDNLTCSQKLLARLMAAKKAYAEYDEAVAKANAVYKEAAADAYKRFLEKGFGDAANLHGQLMGFEGFAFRIP